MAIAMKSANGQEYTYRELEELSRSLMAAMQEHGLEPGSVVALYGNKEPAVYAGLLAILRGGYVALPIDSSLPAERQQILAKEAQAGFALICSADSSRAVAPVPAFQLEPQTCKISAFNGSKASRGLELNERAAYVFFTSGTTGKPKGVIGGHRALGHFISWQIREYGTQVGDRIPQLASISFDAMLKDVFLAFCSGATLLLPPFRPYEDPDRLLEWLDREQATIVQTVPSVVSSWLSSATRTQSSLRAVRLLCLAGEPLTSELVDRWRRSFGSVSNEIINLYGTTESTILKSFYRVPAQPPQGVLPLGKPLPETELLVVNSQNEIRAAGETGEIVIRTANGTMGSIQEWDKDSDAVRSYATGDLGYYEPDGALRILGRIDDQVKINGVRVNPAEIAGVLSTCPGVQECAVMPLESAGGRCIVAYVVSSTPDLSSDNIQRYLAARLPGAMIPGQFVFLDRMPVTPNGKLDKRKLPVPSFTVSPSAPLPSESPIIEVVRSIWAQVLRKQDLDVDENFFALDGHSLLIFQVIARLRKIFNSQINLASFFKNPTVRMLATEISSAVNSRADQAYIVPLPEDYAGPVPLSPAQFRLWFLAQLDPAGTSYNMTGAIRLPQASNEELVSAAIRQTVLRQEALRTTIHPSEDGPRQIIHPEPRIDFGAIRLRESSADAQWKEAHAVAATIAGEPFDLQSGPLVRARYVFSEETGHLLILVIHHVVCDAWSWGLIARDLLTYLNASLSGEQALLPELKIQYRDYAVWQRQYLSEDVIERQLGYWRDKLSGCPSTNLPADLQRPQVLSSSGASYKFLLSEETSDRIRTLAVSAGATPFMVLLAGFAALIARQAGQNDVVIGSDFAGRSFVELENVVGFFVSTVALRFDLPHDLPFMETLVRVRQTVLDAYTHQEVPFEKIVEILNPRRDLTRSPIFQIMFRTPPASGHMERPDMEMLDFGHSNHIAKFDLTLVVANLQGRIQCAIEYSTDLFDHRRIVFLGAQYQSFLSQVSREPKMAIGSPFICEAEISQFHLEPWTRVPEPSQPSLLDSIRHIAERNPDAVAIIGDSRQWTFQELHIAIERFASRLVSMSIKPGERICLHGPGCFGMVVAMVGVLQIGAVAVPIDERLPDGRKAMLISEAQTALIVDFGDLSGKDEIEVAKLALDPDLRSIETDLPPATLVELDPGAPAYLFFTSGSTGKPKAVLGQHKGLLHFCLWEMKHLSIGSGDRIAQLTSFSFDAVLREIFVPLLSGATLCLPPAQFSGSILDTLNWLDKEKISIIHVVPSVFATWANTNGSLPLLSSLRAICLSGEPLDSALVRKWKARMPACLAKFYNFYGATECTMIQSCLLVPDEPVAGILPIGPGISDTQLFVLSPENRLCGVGEIGEVTVRTRFGSLGYFNENTSCLMSNPFINDPDDLIYRTGDLGRLNPDGSISLAGRKDDQLKIRGVRVEIGEVLAILSDHPNIQRAFVMPRKHVNGETELLAYIVAAEGLSVTSSQIRSYLAQRLPAAMVPAWVFALDAIPILPNGKVDRSQLPLPSEAAKHSGELPVTETERKIASLWARLLGLKHIYRSDEFFEIGGHSLLATAVISDVRSSLGAEVSLRSLFENPTLAAFATAVDELSTSAFKANDSPLIVLSSGKNLQSLYCIHPISGGIGCYRTLAAKLDCSVIGIQAFGIEEGTTPIDDLPTLARIYGDAILEHHRVGHIHLLGWSLGGVLAYEMARQLKNAGEPVGLLSLLDTYAPVPSLYQAPEKLGNAGVLRNLLGDLSTITDCDLQSELQLDSIPDDQQMEVAFQFLNGRGIIGVDGEPAGLRRRADVIISNLRAAHNYRFRPAKLSFTLFSAAEEPRPHGVTNALCWDELPIEAFDVIPVRGSHRTMVTKYAEEVAMKLSALMANYKI
jgi:amino acid adenylation domain-containing protein